TVTPAFGATAAGKVISTRCRSPRGSCPGLKLAAALPTVTDFTLALELRRSVSVRPGPLPTFVALMVATPLSERSAGCTFALTSNELTCQMTVAGACAPACVTRQRMSASKRSVLIVGLNQKSTNADHQRYEQAGECRATSRAAARGARAAAHLVRLTTLAPGNRALP